MKHVRQLKDSLTCVFTSTPQKGHNLIIGEYPTKIVGNGIGIGFDVLIVPAPKHIPDLDKLGVLLVAPAENKFVYRTTGVDDGSCDP